jgi:hypothetical protein
VLTNAQLSPNDMQEFALIRHLDTIEIANDPKIKYLEFSASIVPLLKLKGHQLKSLSLSHFDEVDTERK